MHDTLASILIAATIGASVPPFIVSTTDGTKLVWEFSLGSMDAPEKSTQSIVIEGDGRELSALRSATELQGALAATFLGDATPTRVALVWLDIGQSPVPQRITASVSNAEKDRATVSATLSAEEPPHLVAPLLGGPWVAVYDPNLQRGHRRVFYAVDGVPRIPGRFAIDFFRVDAKGRMYSGPKDDMSSWHGYGAPVVAVADAEVVAAVDGRPDGRSRAANEANAGAGNYIVLRLSPDRFAFYEHLRPGSLAVREGMRVKAGQRIAQLGNSGDTAGPHLHFHVADGPMPLGAEGKPFVLKELRLLGRYGDISAAFSSSQWDAKASRDMTDVFPSPNDVLQFGAED